MRPKDELDLLLKYPMVLSKNHSNTEYHGYIQVDENDYRLDFSVKNNKYNLKLDGDLKPFSKQIRQILRDSYKSPVDFLNRLTSILKNSNKTKIVDSTDLYRKVLREYYELRQFFFNIRHSKLSRDLRTIEIVHEDVKSRKHPILINVDYFSEDKTFAISKCDLPEYQKQIVTKPENSLLSVYENFLTVVNCPQLQALFDLLDEIDKNCWVLDPEKPKRGDVHRRIMLDDQVSVVVTFNSKNFTEMPQIKFLGPLNATKKYSEVLNRNYINYKPNGDILLELHNLLEINAFPRQPEDLLEEELLIGEGECSICFSKWLNGKLPEVVCNNSSCGLNFHVDCLYQWLQSLNSRKYYYEIYGNCPNCEKTIHCTLPSTTT